MNILLTGFNTLFILFFGWFGMLLQSTLFHDFFGIYKPNVILVLIAYLALNRFLIEGGVLVFLLGYIIELNSGAPFGFYSCVFVLTFYALKLVCEGFYIKTAWAEICLVAGAALFYKAFTLLVSAIYSDTVWNLATHLSSLLAMLLLNVLLAPLVFWILKLVDEATAKARPSKTGTQDPAVRLE